MKRMFMFRPLPGARRLVDATLALVGLPSLSLRSYAQSCLCTPANTPEASIAGA